ncbi:Lsr2 family DNA-binding protein [Streptomyces mauvecolor]
MRKTVLVPVEHRYCDAHIARDGSEVEATATLTLGHRAWDLCVDHRFTFAKYLVDALGSGVPEADKSDSEAKPDPAMVAEPAPVAVEPESEAVVQSEAGGADEVDSDASEPEPVRSLMLAGEVPGYDWESARAAVRNLGYEVVGRADDSTVLLILGEGGDRNGTKLRDAKERDLPVMDVRAPGRFKSAVRAGELVGSDPLPEPAKVGPKVMSERERNKVMRAWAREHGYTVPTKGHIPMGVRRAYELTQRDSAGGKAVAA